MFKRHDFVRMGSASLALIAAVILTILVSSVEDALERDAQRVSRDLVNEFTYAIEQYLELISVLLRDLTGMLQVASITEQEFNDFIEHTGVMDRVSGLRAIALMPVIERDLVAQVNKNLKLRAIERSNAGYPPTSDIVIRPGQNYVAPALYAVSPDGIEGILGFNPLDDEKRLDAALKAMESGELIVSPPVVLSQDQGSTNVSYLALRVAPTGRLSSNAKNLPTISPASGNARGAPVLVGAGVTIGQMLDSLWPQYGQNFSALKVYDFSENAATPLFSKGVDTADFSSIDPIDIPFGQRLIRVYLSPAEYEGRELSRLGLWVLWAVACLTLLALTISMDRLIRFRRDLTRLVEARTVELDATNAALVESSNQAQQANKAKSEFLAHMSHELRTPLNSVIGFSQIMLDEMLGPLGNKQYLEYAKLINDAGEHQLGVVDDILDLASIEAGKRSFEMVEVDLTALARNCLEIVRVQADEKGVGLSAKTPAQQVTVQADVRSVRQIILNLLANAVKFTGDGGQITILVDGTSGGGARLVVRDTGVGIAPSDMERVLQPFGQVRMDSFRSHGGVGLGLPICRQLMQAHGGDLALESRLGEGTSVILWFPTPEQAPDQARLKPMTSPELDRN